MKYISKSDGSEAGVFLTTEEWNRVKTKFSGIENELENDFYELTDEQDKAIELAIASINDSKGIPNEEVVKETKARYSRLFRQ